MTIEQLLQVLGSRVKVLDDERRKCHAFSEVWEEFYGRTSEVEAIIELLHGNYSDADYVNWAIETVEDGAED